MTAQPAIVLDLIGLKCPLPVLRTRKALLELHAGGVVEVRSSDPLSAVDIPHLVRELGDRLLAQDEERGIFSFKIEKAAR